MRQTAGELSLKAESDKTKYDSLEVGHAISDDIGIELRKCIDRHNPIFDEEEYCVGFVLASDPLLKNVMRKKFFAMLYMPSPRPSQAVFLYNKKKDDITKRLWVLPNAATMAELSEMWYVAPQYKSMQRWSKAFFKLRFWQCIRREHNIDLLSESEYLKLNREKLIEARGQETNPLTTEPFDFSKITSKKVIDSKAIIFNEGVFNNARKA